MSIGSKKKIIRLLGVGFDADDGHIRITKGEKFDILMGSDESHEYLAQLIARIESEIKKRGMNLDEMTPEELSEIIKGL